MAQEPDQFERLASSTTWHRLMHYRKATFGGYKSDLDGPEFFFSPKGKTDPLAELHASAEAFGKDIQVGKLKQHPQCAFPERYRFLKKELSLSFADVPCPKLDEFLARFHHPKSVSFVFSNAYPDNPASMFGHTFLRINAGDSGSGKPGEKLDLLDQGVSYAANVGPDENPLVFYWFGLTGGYPGAFTVVPYYVKVNEYSHAEARDLWEYDLDLNPEQTLTLLRHLWEIETNSWFDYWFFDENCAYELLTLLEVARPDWKMSDRAGAWVIPGETVKVVTRTPGAVKSVKFRPSYRRTLLKRFEALSPEQREKFFDARKGKIQATEISDVQTIDALSAYLTYQKQKNEGKLPAEDKQLLTQTLIRRSELGPESPSRELAETDSLSGSTWNTRPDQGHDATRLSLTTGIAGLASTFHVNSQDHSGLYFQELHWRSAYHDLLNNDEGYLRFSQIEFPNLTLRYYPKLSDVRVERIGLLSVLSLFPMSSLEKKPSWGLDLAYQSPKDYGCLTCHTLRGRAFVGAAGLPLSPHAMIYGLALANAEVGESLRKGWRVGPGAHLAALANPVAPYKLQLHYELVSDLFQSDRSSTFYEFSTEHSWSLNSVWELRAQYSFTRNSDEAKLGLQYYF
jgi:hypothetical protein